MNNIHIYTDKTINDELLVDELQPS